jgi:hypothetical protein
VEGEPLDLDAWPREWGGYGSVPMRAVSQIVAALRSERARADGLQQAFTAAVEVRQKVEAERDEAREERDALLALRDSWANDYASLATFMRERDEARAEVERLRRLWAMCDARSDHDARCFTVTTATPYPKPDAEGCDCGLRALWTAMEAK